jgi:hypothetical protein
MFSERSFFSFANLLYFYLRLYFSNPQGQDYLSEFYFVCKGKFIRIFNYVIKHCHEGVWGNGGIAPPFLTSALYGCEWSSSHTCPFTSRKEVPGTHWIGSWMGPRTGVDAMEKRKSPASAGN